MNPFITFAFPLGLIVPPAVVGLITVIKHVYNLTRKRWYPKPGERITVRRAIYYDYHIQEIKMHADRWLAPEFDVGDSFLVVSVVHERVGKFKTLARGSCTLLPERTGKPISFRWSEEENIHLYSDFDHCFRPELPEVPAPSNDLDQGDEDDVE